jgi:hypothetical protein
MPEEKVLLMELRAVAWLLSDGTAAPFGEPQYGYPVSVMTIFWFLLDNLALRRLIWV